MEEQVYMNKIHYFKEKKWIMAWWFKKNGNITESRMMHQWMQWWKDDFSNIKDQRFKDAFKWVRDTIDTKTKEEICKGRYDCACSCCKPIAKPLQELAISKGYYIRKSSIKKKPLNVSGYAIFKNGENKPVYGKNYDLTIKQVNEFLENK